MEKQKSKMFPRKPTKKEIKVWSDKVLIEGYEIKELPNDISTYIAILLGV